LPSCCSHILQAMDGEGPRKLDASCLGKGIKHILTQECAEQFMRWHQQMIVLLEQLPVGRNENHVLVAGREQYGLCSARRAYLQKALDKISFVVRLVEDMRLRNEPARSNNGGILVQRTASEDADDRDAMSTKCTNRG